MAQFCMLTGQTPEVYLSLTVREHNAFVDVANKRVGRRKRRK